MVLGALVSRRLLQAGTNAVLAGGKRRVLLLMTALLLLRGRASAMEVDRSKLVVLSGFGAGLRYASCVIESVSTTI